MIELERNENALNNLVGKVMGRSNGAADAETASKHLKKLLRD